MTEQEELKAYHSELDHLREASSANDVARDSTLIQLSVGVLTIVTAFGKDILSTNKTLAIVMIASLGLSILILVIGFWTNTNMFTAIREKMYSNIQNKRHFYDEYTTTFWQSVNTSINVFATATFIVGMIAFISLILIYIGGSNV